MEAAELTANPINEPRRTGRRILLTLLALLSIAAIAAGGWMAWTRFRPAPPAASHQALSTATVTRRDLTSQEQVNGTLGYGDQSPLLNRYSSGQGGGTVTGLPSAGQVISRGQTLYSVDNVPIPLFYGDQPFWRQLTTGVSGHDVTELEQNLLALGYANSSNLSTDGTFTAADQAAVKRWQAALGLTQTGVVNPGDVVIEPGAVRVYDLKANLGGSVGPGAPVMDVTSTTRQVQISLDASLQSLVKVGDAVTVTLPGTNQTVTGKVSSIGSVATASSNNNNPGNGAPQATVQVFVSLDNPGATGTIDQAPVNVSITSNRAANVLAVPINALLALAEGGYALEVADSNGKTQLVPVQTGLFDDQDSLVQVTGPGIDAGTKVVVPQGL
jgi:peptidoglycan hydrolase-like protein with peptidoglycan-binding domain